MRAEELKELVTCMRLLNTSDDEMKKLMTKGTTVINMRVSLTFDKIMVDLKSSTGISKVIDIAEDTEKLVEIIEPIMLGYAKGISEKLKDRIKEDPEDVLFRISKLMFEEREGAAV